MSFHCHMYLQWNYDILICSSTTGCKRRFFFLGENISPKSLSKAALYSNVLHFHKAISSAIPDPTSHESTWDSTGSSLEKPLCCSPAQLSPECNVCRPLMLAEVKVHTSLDIRPQATRGNITSTKEKCT